VDANFEGASATLDVGQYDWGQLGIPNDSLSSLRVPAGLRATLYDDTHFGGRSKTFAQDADYVGDDFNDITSSIVVAPGGTPLSPGDINEIITAHNNYRAAVGVGPLTWSEELAAGAQAWADHLAATHTFEHSGTPGVGENLAAFTTGFKTPAELVDLWGSEEAAFIPPCASWGNQCSTTGNWMDIGHYTQLVWRATTQVGCGFAHDTTLGNDILVARYSPPGNFAGEPVY